MVLLLLLTREHPTSRKFPAGTSRWRWYPPTVFDDYSGSRLLAIMVEVIGHHLLLLGRVSLRFPGTAPERSLPVWNGRLVLRSLDPATRIKVVLGEVLWLVRLLLDSLLVTLCLLLHVTALSGSCRRVGLVSVLLGRRHLLGVPRVLLHCHHGLRVRVSILMTDVEDRLRLILLRCHYGLVRVTFVLLHVLLVVSLRREVCLLAGHVVPVLRDLGPLRRRLLHIAAVLNRRAAEMRVDHAARNVLRSRRV